MAISFSIVHGQNTLSLDPFDEINVTGNVEVVLAEGDMEAATLEVENIPEDKVQVRVKGGVLKIKLVESIFYKNEEVRVYVTYRALRALRAEAGALVESKNVIEGDELLARVGTGARVHLRVEVNSLDAGAGEGGELQVAGTTDRQEVSVSTGGQYEALDLECARAYVKANTGGRAEVVALEYLEASANTGGNILYKGDPEDKSLKTVLSGSVEKL